MIICSAAWEIGAGEWEIEAGEQEIEGDAAVGHADQITSQT